ncbi:MAG: hypothetical protein ACI89D_002606 [Bermanella sp.]|jgi:uncharacterized protein YgfB (UPF0149 family)
MSIELPDHDDIANVFVELGALYPPSELHGFFVGQQVLGVRIDDVESRTQVEQLLDIESIKAEHWQHLLALKLAAAAQLGAEISAMALLLPDDDVDLGQRVAAVGSWCQGFLTGFAMAGKQRQTTEGQQQYSKTVSEILSDIAAISQAGLDSEESDETQAHFQALVEYLEMATVTIFVECCAQEVLKGEHPAPKQVH